MRVLNTKVTNEGVYIGRGSIYGNPFSHNFDSKALVIVSSREMAIEMYALWILGKIVVPGVSPPSREQIMQLKGQDLRCYCAPLPCHGEILINAIENPRFWEDV